MYIKTYKDFHLNKNRKYTIQITFRIEYLRQLAVIFINILLYLQNQTL